MNETNNEPRMPHLSWNRKVRRGLVGLMALIFVGSLGWWYATRDTLPEEIVIAGGLKGGLYDQFARALADRLSARTGRKVWVLPTEGSEENRQRLLSRTPTAHLAIMKAGAVSMTHLAVLAPLYPDVVHLLVRKGRGMHSIADLSNRRVAIGPERSGMNALALQILRHYRVDAHTHMGSEQRFERVLADPSLDAAIITTGCRNPDLARVFRTGQFDLLPIEDGAALSLYTRYLTEYEIPRGAIAEGPAVPDHPVTTVATTAALAARADAGPALVRAALEALYDGELLEKFPYLISTAAARSWPVLPLHETARRYFDPRQGLDTLGVFLQSLNAGKELLFALVAGIYLLWDRWRHAREREHEREVHAAKERLDQYLQEAVRIERSQMGAWDRETLRACLVEVTHLKLDALESLTHESLRGDRLFLIFLTQCASLIQKIQLKLELGESRAGALPSSPS